MFVIDHSFVTRQIVDGVLIISGTDGRPLRTLGSSLLGGGLSDKKHLVNAQVPHGYTSNDPWRDLEQKVVELGLPLEDTVGMMTAANVERVVEAFASGEEFQLRVYVTAGVGNAARAGRARKTYPGYTAGTINTIAVIDGRLTDAALINAVLTITEAKTAALQDLGVIVYDGSGAIATGTTTDAVIVAATQNPAYKGVHQYAGLATELGNALGMTVYQALTESLRDLERQEQERTGERREGERRDGRDTN